jgi:hypothetical protein
MKASKELITSVSNIARQQLLLRGFSQRRKDSRFTIQLNDDVVGSVGLNRAVNTGDGSLQINPVVAVSHQPLEKLVAELRGVKFDRDAATLLTNLGYVMPQKDELSYEFTGYNEHAPTVSDMMNRIARYGIPWMRSYIELESVQRAIVQLKYGWRDHFSWREPVGFYLLGNIRDAKASLQKHLGRIGKRDTMADHEYREFARNLKRRLRTRRVSIQAKNL